MHPMEPSGDVTVIPKVTPEVVDLGNHFIRAGAEASSALSPPARTLEDGRDPALLTPEKGWANEAVKTFNDDDAGSLNPDNTRCCFLSRGFPVTPSCGHKATAAPQAERQKPTDNNPHIVGEDVLAATLRILTESVKQWEVAAARQDGGDSLCDEPYPAPSSDALASSLTRALPKSADPSLAPDTLADQASSPGSVPSSATSPSRTLLLFSQTSPPVLQAFLAAISQQDKNAGDDDAQCGDSQTFKCGALYDGAAIVGDGSDSAIQAPLVTPRSVLSSTAGAVDSLPLPSDAKDFLQPSIDNDFLQSSIDKDFLQPSIDKDFLQPSIDKDFPQPSNDRDFRQPSNDRDFRQSQGQSHTTTMTATRATSSIGLSAQQHPTLLAPRLRLRLRRGGRCCDRNEDGGPTFWGMWEDERSRMVYVSWLPRTARANDRSEKKSCEMMLKEFIQIVLGFSGLEKVLLFPPSSAHCKLLFANEHSARGFLSVFGGLEYSNGPALWKLLVCRHFAVNIREGIQYTRVKIIWADQTKNEDDHAAFGHLAGVAQAMSALASGGEWHHYRPQQQEYFYAHHACQAATANATTRTAIPPPIVVGTVYPRRSQWCSVARQDAPPGVAIQCHRHFASTAHIPGQPANQPP